MTGRRQPAARPQERPTHPMAKATILMVGVVLLIVVLALMSMF